MQNILLKLLCIAMFISLSNASFYENRFSASQTILSAFDIDTSFQADVNLFELHNQTISVKDGNLF